MVDDAPLQALMLPFAGGALPWPDDGALFLDARDGWPLRERPLPGLVVEQASRPLADALRAAGHVFDQDDARRFPSVLLLPPRQREAMRARFARALGRCAPGGAVVASVANDSGAKSAEADLRRLAGGLEGSLSKHHCRVFWARNTDAVDVPLQAQWRALDAPRRIEAKGFPGGGFHSRPGVFAWDRIDPASALLAAQLPPDLAGRGADLGAGWGYLSLQVLARCAGVRALDLFEADARALELARRNLADVARAHAAELAFHWHDVATGLPHRYDFIVSNPPFHAHDRSDRPDLGRRFIEAAAQALRPGGRLLLVANRHLPYESTLAAGFGRVRVLAQRDGFKAIEAVRA